MTELRLASRGSALARAQVEWVAEALSARNPGLEVELVIITTTGDTDTTTPVTHLTELGAFVRAVQQAVLDGRADAAVHSCKDLPVDGPGELAAVYPVREAPWDVLCGASLDELPAGARVGTGSPRRSSQLAALRPDLRIQEIRGNIDTRLRKVETGDYDAVVLAEAGLRRLFPGASRSPVRGADMPWKMRFGLDQMVPAPAQGALAVESRLGSEAAAIVGSIDDGATRIAVDAERAVLALTHIGCRGALGAYAETGAHGIRLTGFVDDEGGRRRATVEASTPMAAAIALCHKLELVLDETVASTGGRLGETTSGGGS